MTHSVTIKLGKIPERPERRVMRETGPIAPFRAEVDPPKPGEVRESGLVPGAAQAAGVPNMTITVPAWVDPDLGA